MAWRMTVIGVLIYMFVQNTIIATNEVLALTKLPTLFKPINPFKQRSLDDDNDKSDTSDSIMSIMYNVFER